MAIEELTMEEKRSFYRLGQKYAIRFLITRADSTYPAPLRPNGVRSGFNDFLGEMFLFSVISGEERKYVRTGGHALLVCFLEVCKEESDPEKALRRIRGQFEKGELEEQAAWSSPKDLTPA